MMMCISSPMGPCASDHTLPQTQQQQWSAVTSQIPSTNPMGPIHFMDQIASHSHRSVLIPARIANLHGPD